MRERVLLSSPQAASAFDPPTWTSFTHPKGVSGIWGLHDELVFAWGGLNIRPHLSRWDGQTWTEVETPGAIVGMHGVRDDLIFAVGYQGMIARFDGHRWQRMASPTHGVLSHVLVVDENEIYATGNAEMVFAGTVWGWEERAAVPDVITGIAKYADRVFLAGGTWGLLELVGNRVKTVTEDFFPIGLRSGSSLLAWTEESIVETQDGETFESLPIDLFRDLIRSTPPLWKR